MCSLYKTPRSVNCDGLFSLKNSPLPGSDAMGIPCG